MKTLIFIIISIFIILKAIDNKSHLLIEVKEEESMKVEEDKNNNEGTIELMIDQKFDLGDELLSSIQEVNPLKSYKVWTYIEFINGRVPYFFRKCIQKMKKEIPNLIILTPNNIKQLLPKFKVDMSNNDIPLKKRVDLLYASILAKYGGLCISPGTIIINIDTMLNKLKKYELVTIGSSPNVLNSHNSLFYPNTYVIGAQKGLPIIAEYKRLLSQSIKGRLLNNDINMNDSSYILSYLLPKIKTKQFHFGTEYDGTYDDDGKVLNINNYLSKSPINFLNEDKLILISIPYDELLLDIDNIWVLNLTMKKFNKSNLEIQRLLN